MRGNLYQTISQKLFTTPRRSTRRSRFVGSPAAMQLNTPVQSMNQALAPANILNTGNKSPFNANAPFHQPARHQPKSDQHQGRQYRRRHRDQWGYGSDRHKWSRPTANPLNRLQLSLPRWWPTPRWPPLPRLQRRPWCRSWFCSPDLQHLWWQHGWYHAKLAWHPW